MCAGGSYLKVDKSAFSWKIPSWSPPGWEWSVTYMLWAARFCGLPKHREHQAEHPLAGKQQRIVLHCWKVHVLGFMWAVWAPERRRAQPGAVTAPWVAQRRRCISAHPRDHRPWRHSPVGCIAGHCLKAEGPGCAGDVLWRRRALSAGSKLIQMHRQHCASRLPAKGDGKPRCPFTTSKAAHST